MRMSFSLNCSVEWPSVSLNFNESFAYLIICAVVFIFLGNNCCFIVWRPFMWWRLMRFGSNSLECFVESVIIFRVVVLVLLIVWFVKFGMSLRYSENGVGFLFYNSVWKFNFFAVFERK